MMRIVIAPNAFKNSLSAQETAHCIAEGLRQSRLSCDLTLIPIADGGDGTASLIAQKLNSEKIAVPVRDPLGRLVNASFGWLAEDKIAIIELSEASGLRLLQKDELNPLIANTKGTGELIRAALDKGSQKLIIGVGGSATVDGGSGLLSALGIQFLNQEGESITDFPTGLMKLKSINLQGLDVRLMSCNIVVLCDVRNKLLGEKGAAIIFGPQKGANNKQVLLLQKCLQQLNKISKEVLKKDMASLVHGGAAGGVAAGMAAFLSATLVSGIDYFLDVVGFDGALHDADLLITAEGSVDSQTFEGKGPFGVAVRAKEKKIPVIVLAGQVPLKIGNEMHKYFNAILPIGHEPSSLEASIQHSADDLIRTSCELGNVLALPKSP